MVNTARGKDEGGGYEDLGARESTRTHSRHPEPPMDYSILILCSQIDYLCFRRVKKGKRREGKREGGEVRNCVFSRPLPTGHTEKEVTGQYGVCVVQNVEYRNLTYTQA